MKYTFIILGLIGLLLVGCAQQSVQESTTTQEGITVASTFFPLYELSRMVVGTAGEVFSIVPTHSEPHSFQLTPQDIVRLNEADIYVTLGIEFEEFEEELVESSKGGMVIVKAAGNIDVIDIDEDEHDEHDEDGHEEEGHDEDDHDDEHDEPEEEDHDDEHDEDEHDHGGVDPHVWLSPKNAIQMVQNIAEGLKVADPQNAAVYDANANSASQQLAALDSQFASGLASCNKDTILVAHNAYSYLGRDYGFKTIEIHGLSPESEPTPKQIANLIDEAKEHDLKYVFYEELVDPRVSETIAKQVGAETLALNPVAGTKDGSATYISLMEQNLANLKLALECE